MAQTDLTQEFRIALFGPQSPHWTHESLVSLQSAIRRNSHLHFIIEAFAQLPSLWPKLVRDCGISGTYGEEKLIELDGFVSGRTVLNTNNLSNIHLAPLTLVSHIADFVQLIDTAGTSESLPGFHAAQGFCIGFLSAAALSSSRDWTEFKCNVSNSLRLAACIGAIIDSQDAGHAPPDRATAISVRWNTPSDRAYLEASLDLFPDAYISCVPDECTLTIAMPESNQASLCARLGNMRIPTMKIGLDGWYHHPKNAKVAASLKRLCTGNEELQLPDAHKLHMPLRSTADTDLIATGALHEVAIDLILCKRAHWFQTVQQTIAQLPPSQVKFIPLGKQSCIPSSLSSGKLNSTLSRPINNKKEPASRPEEVAVVGMACRFPEADSIEEFWQLLNSGQTSIGQLPTARFDPADIAREPKLAYWGNFIRRPDVFDHRFFGISGREAKSMDPQQRLALQVAYEALESSGYVALSEVEKESETTSNVGCYMGVGAVDYEANVASEDANAFAATGTLRAFISGRISHFFGWTGPSVTIDTACSSSAVAIHTACKALLAGECSTALAGGVNVITSPNLYQNLSAASFLNPSGSSRAFDASASGYCRGEGAGILILKPFSKALADGDTILGVISGSAVNQGSNCSPITVPDAQSQRSLYERALSVARIEPTEVTYVEAHGTGTVVGDPIEYESVQLALTGPRRNETLFLGSVKDNIGHTEAASGVAGVIKTILMMQHGTIPKQANFVSLNPRIKYSPTFQMEVPTATQRWTARHHIALVNNYGAAGSNTAIVLREHSQTSPIFRETDHRARILPPSAIYPIFLSAKSADSLQSYVTALKSYSPDVHTSIQDIAYNIARRQNSSFKHRIAFTAGNMEDLTANLIKLSTNSNGAAVPAKQLPVVLCFGGQIGNGVSISKDLYDGCDLFRKHLDECDEVCQALGLQSIFPEIFQGGVIENIVTLHCALLSLQVSTARCWLDCGLVIDTLIGHSFGQISALCIADSISLRDAFHLISSRALLIRDKWGPEQGTMMSVECDREELESVVNLVNSTPDLRVDVACYNGSRSFVLAGDASSMARAVEGCQSFKTAKLENTHAYHSYLTDGILDDFKVVAESISIQPPRIHVETCSAMENWSQFDAEKLVQHTRQAVYFDDAVERIAARLPSAMWFEAGSASPIIAMTRRILRKTNRLDTFIPIHLGSAGAIENLAEAACQMWRAGSNAQHWLFHRSLRPLHPYLNLPPYQFEQTRHWIEYKPSSARSPPVFNPDPTTTGLKLVNLVENRSSKGEYLFLVDTSNVIFDLAVRGHIVAGYSLCPASMYIELAIRCAMEIPGCCPTLPHIEALAMLSPLGRDGDSTVMLRLLMTAPNTWNFALFSHPSMHGRMEDGGIEHARGRISLSSVTDVAESRLQTLKKFARISHADRISKSAWATGISGPIVYELFSDVVNYADYYRGVKSLSALDNEAVGCVAVPADRHFGRDPLVCDPISLDNFLQVAGIHVNCLSPRKDDEIFICSDVEEFIFSPSFMKGRINSQTQTVYTRFEVASKGKMINDIFVYNEPSRTLVVAILGATFRSVPRKSLARTLAKLNNASTTCCNTTDSKSDQDSGYQTPLHALAMEDQSERIPAIDLLIDRSTIEPYSGAYHMEQLPRKIDETGSILQLVCQMLSDIMEIPVTEIVPTSLLDDIGIDSLLVTEVLAEIQKRFDVSITQTQFVECTSVLSLSRCIQPNGTVENSQPNLTEFDAASPRQPYEDDASYEESSPRQPYEDDDGYEESSRTNLAEVCHDCFVLVKGSYEVHARSAGFTDFCSEVFPLQSRLVVQYVVEAFKSLGCCLQAQGYDDEIPTFRYDPRHTKVVRQLHKILEEAGLVKKDETGKFRRTSTPVLPVPACIMQAEMLAKFPKHASETKLLQTTGSRLADCLSGKADPLALLFGDAAARATLEDVYTHAPMFRTGSMLLVQYLSSALQKFGNNREVRILELGAGTGGTTLPLVEQLAGQTTKAKFSYTFTDLSPSLVAAARRKFGKWPFMKFAVVDVEKNPGPELMGAYDIIISTNCIHATKDLVYSTTNIRKMLSADGVLCLVELTQNLFWFDLVFGLLEGWWLSSDGREHALADEQRWKKCLQAAGFNWVDWTQSTSSESSILRLITATTFQAETTGTISGETRDNRQTMVFKNVDGLDLLADIYYPSDVVDASKSLPVALMIHGGGHIMLSRNDIRPEQTQMLLERGFLPISVDYRLCPETTLLEGPMTDVVDALVWIRTVLPHLALARTDIRVDGERVVSVGWSTGGHLAMSLAWTSHSRNIRPPEAILSFYSPTDYEDTFWVQPNLPIGARDPKIDSDPASLYELDEKIWEAVYNHPLTSYNVAPEKRALGGWLAPSDPRSRLALHMNSQGRTLHVLLNGLDRITKSDPLPPTAADIAAASPLANIRSGLYSSPTFIIHPREDDLIPWQQSQRTWEAMRAQGVSSTLRIVDEVPHLFDMYREHKRNKVVMRIVTEGYDFLQRYV